MSEKLAIARAKQIVELLHERRINGLIDFTQSDINNFVESVGLLSDGKWGYFVNEALHRKLPLKILNEIEDLV